MDGPAQVLHGLIDAQAVLSSLWGSKAVMLDLQPVQHWHAAFGQGVALDPLVAQIGRHPLEVLFEEADDLLVQDTGGEHEPMRSPRSCHPHAYSPNESRPC